MESQSTVGHCDLSLLKTFVCTNHVKFVITDNELKYKERANFCRWSTERQILYMHHIFPQQSSFIENIIILSINKKSEAQQDYVTGKKVIKKQQSWGYKFRSVMLIQFCCIVFLIRFPKFQALFPEPSTVFSSVQFSRSVLSDSLRPHESQHARPPCPSPTPGVHSDSCPSSQ